MGRLNKPPALWCGPAPFQELRTAVEARQERFRVLEEPEYLLQLCCSLGFLNEYLLDFLCCSLGFLVVIICVNILPNPFLIMKAPSVRMPWASGRKS